MRELLNWIRLKTTKWVINTRCNRFPFHSQERNLRQAPHQTLNQKNNQTRAANQRSPGSSAGVEKNENKRRHHRWTLKQSEEKILPDMIDLYYMLVKSLSKINTFAFDFPVSIPRWFGTFRLETILRLHFFAVLHFLIVCILGLYIVIVHWIVWYLSLLFFFWHESLGI